MFKKKTDARSLLESLFPEVMQTEMSAVLHCDREATRLDGRAGRPMHQVSKHARASLAKLERMGKARGFAPPSIGKSIGRIFSETRDKVADRLVSAETSYRGTMIGMRHGYDLLSLTHAVARETGDEELAAFCSSWLETRGPLIEDAAKTLSWFAHHPAAAQARAVPLLPFGRSRLSHQ